MLDYGKKTYIMGILNVTPDSFSDGGDYTNIDIAVNHAKEMIELGADMIDLGGESTRPGHKFVSAEEEISRIVPVIKRLKEEIAKKLTEQGYTVSGSTVTYYGDKTTRYSYRAKKTLSFAAAQPLRSAVKAKMRSSKAFLWVASPSLLRFSRRKTAAIRTGGKRLVLT